MKITPNEKIGRVKENKLGKIKVIANEKAQLIDYSLKNNQKHRKKILIKQIKTSKE